MGIKYTLIFLLLFSSSVQANIYCPVPPDQRVPNYTGVQCVWSTLQLIGKWCEDERLYNLTDKYKNASDPNQVAQVLSNKGIPFKQTNNKEEGSKLLEQSTKNSIPALIGVYGSHAISVVHYDPAANKAAIIDNSNLQKGIQIITVTKLDSMRDGWSLILYPGSRHKTNNSVKVTLEVLLDENK